MSGRSTFLANRWVRSWLAVFLSLLSVLELQAAELRVEFRLIWGTNEQKISDPHCKPLDKPTIDKMRKVFAWTNYCEINRQTNTIPSRSSKKIKMSPQCTIDFKELEGPKVEVMLIGDGKPVNKTTYPLRKGESIAIAGDGKNGSAWFVFITELDEK